MKRKIYPPIGNSLSCENWQIEAAYRMIQNNLHPDVAEFPEDLILREAQLAGSSNLVSGATNELLEVHINSSGFVSPFLLVFSLPDVSKSWIIETKGIMGKLLIREL